MKIIYGTGNHAKFQSMQRALAHLPIELIRLQDAAEEKKITLPKIEEDGHSPLENARIKALQYYRVLQEPVFSCDSGLFLWNHHTGEPLPEEEQPGIHVRGREAERYTDGELLEYYTGLVKKYGLIRARYQNGICVVFHETRIYESMDESLCGEAFLFTDKPHKRYIPGFPLDSISLDIRTGQYYYDLPDDSQDSVAADVGFARFFEKILSEF